MSKSSLWWFFPYFYILWTHGGMLAAVVLESWWLLAAAFLGAYPIIGLALLCDPDRFPCKGGFLDFVSCEPYVCEVCGHSCVFEPCLVCVISRERREEKERKARALEPLPGSWF